MRLAGNYPNGLGGERANWAINKPGLHANPFTTRENSYRNGRNDMVFKIFDELILEYGFIESDLI